VKFYAIDEDQLKKLRAVAARLYTEERLNGDAMRDLAHTIEAVTRVVVQLPIDETES
jgi:hypothetical protein